MWETAGVSQSRHLKKETQKKNQTSAGWKWGDNSVPTFDTSIIEASGGGKKWEE